MPTLLSILSNAFKAIVAALGMAKDKELRNEGAIAQTAADLLAENKRLSDALKASNLTDADILERLRDGRF